MGNHLFVMFTEACLSRFTMLILKPDGLWRRMLVSGRDGLLFTPALCTHAGAYHDRAPLELRNEAVPASLSE